MSFTISVQEHANDYDVTKKTLLEHHASATDINNNNVNKFEVKGERGWSIISYHQIPIIIDKIVIVAVCNESMSFIIFPTKLKQFFKMSVTRYINV